MKKEAVKSVHGQETIGSAYRANNTEEMWDQFHSIVDGKYAEILSEKFGKDRTLESLIQYLKIDNMEPHVKISFFQICKLQMLEN